MLTRNNLILNLGNKTVDLLPPYVSKYLVKNIMCIVVNFLNIEVIFFLFSPHWGH